MLKFSSFDLHKHLELDFSQVKLQLKLKIYYYVAVENTNTWMDYTMVIIPAKYLTDGMSIPSFLQPIIGEPFEGNTIRAALFHDYLCKEQDRPQRITHKLFEMILKEDGFPFWKRKAAYLAVIWYNRLKNPEWK
jgi:hypothetical protein